MNPQVELVLIQVQAPLAGRFKFQQIFFYIKATTKTRQTAIGANYPMARNDNRQRVAAVGSSDGSNRFSSTYSDCNILVGTGFTIRNFQQGIEHIQLKRSALRC